jgi:hypothetical protein
MKTIDELLSQCNLEQRLLVERVLKFTEDRESSCEKREADIRLQRENFNHLAQAFFHDFVVTRMDSEAQWNRWKERHLEQLELKRRDEGARR